MTIGDLAALADVKAWVNPNPSQAMGSQDDSLIQRLITAESGHIKRWLSRDIFMTTYTERYNGRGGSKMVLRNAPTYSISSLVIGNITVPASPDSIVSGFMFDPDGNVFLIGYSFVRASMNVLVTYKAGYYQVDSLTVPTTPFQVAATALSQPWASDIAVAYSTGANLTLVSSAPAVGQYSVSGAGLYTFNTADQGKAINITYGYLPSDITQACIELVSLRYRERKRIGEKSKTVAGESVTFDSSDMPASVKLYLTQHKKVISP